MICQNCQNEVDDDLIFCTNCGERLFQPKSDAQTGLIKDSAKQTAVENPVETVFMNDSVVTQTAIEKPPNQSSNFKWIALIIALIAIPASIFGVYLLTNSTKPQAAQNTNKPKTPAPTATRKANANQNSNANLSNTNANPANANINTNTNTPTPTAKTEIMNERIEIEPDSSYSLSFEVTDETAKIVGKVKVLEGEKIDGFVYLQKSYDEHFPDDTYKIFSFSGAKSAETNQTLVKENYVLVFVNDSENSVVIQGKFSLE